MPVTTRRNPADSVERAQQDDLPAVDDRDENPQEQPQLQTPQGAPRAGAGRPTSLFDRMRASFGGVDAPEGSDDEGEEVAVGPPAFSEPQQKELKNLGCGQWRRCDRRCHRSHVPLRRLVDSFGRDTRLHRPGMSGLRRGVCLLWVTDTPPFGALSFLR